MGSLGDATYKGHRITFFELKVKSLGSCTSQEHLGRRGGKPEGKLYLSSLTASENT